MNKKIGSQAIGEGIFDICYLIFAIGAGIYMIIKAEGNQGILLYGIMALVLGLGDSFHLIPRVCSQLTGKEKQWEAALGTGKLITSITMTIFYIILSYILPAFLGTTLSLWMAVLVWGLAAIRIGLCLMPQNQWKSRHGNYKMGIYRNIPFSILGILVVYEYITGAGGTPLSLVWLAILISFACYLPVVLLAEKKPMVGMLMIPKTCAYIWMIVMGFSLIG